MVDPRSAGDLAARLVDVTRSRRIRHMTTRELERELSGLYAVLACSDEPLDSAEARWERVARELARRDYSHRPHGRDCTCSECMYLLDVWIDHRRRPSS